MLVREQNFGLDDAAAAGMFRFWRGVRQNELLKTSHLFCLKRRYLMPIDFGLAGVAVLLCIGIGFEFCSKSSQEIVGDFLGRQNAGTPQTLGAVVAQPSQVKIWAEKSTARPLFNPDRSLFLALAKAAKAPPSSLVLSGIMISSDNKICIFQDKSGRSILATEGAYVEDLKVLSINEDSVEISGPSGKEQLHVNYGGDDIMPSMLATSTKNLEQSLKSNERQSWPTL